MSSRYNAPSCEIDEEYFHWLCEMVDAKGSDDSYSGLMRQLYDVYFSKQTAKLVGLDCNRIEDGKELREKFKDDSSYLNYDCLNGPCSILELMIALAFKIADLLDDDPEHWFWEMIKNLGLEGMNDSTYYMIGSYDKVDEILNTFLNRKYDKDGFGGLFPLQNPEKDQRKVEIWYQMNAYLIENC